jgi:RAB6A-GEF complex partner protein 2
VTAPSSPRISSPLARSPSLPISSKHPHARKQSVVDGQIPFPQDISVPNTPSSPSFSLSLDPISEGSPGSGPLTSFPTSAPPVIGAVSGFRSQERQADMRASNHPMRRLPLRSNTTDGFGRGPPPPVRDPQLLPMPKIASATTTATSNVNNQPPSDKETILYSYVQFIGSLVITPVAGTTDPQQENALNSLRSSLLKRSIVGGGSMDIAAMLDPSKRRMTPVTRSRTHSRTSSFSSGIFSLLSTPTSLLGSLSAAPAMTSSVSQQWSPSHRSSSSFSLPASRSAPTLSTSSMTASFNGGLGLQRSSSKELYDPEAPLPTYEVQPTLLAVDVSLGPGESRSCMLSLFKLFMPLSSYKSPDTYSLSLPKNLPPTFKGRTFRFSYEFSIGVCRAGASSGNSSANHSRVMKIPVRVYNHVNGQRGLCLCIFITDTFRTVMDQPSPYDLLWPVQCARSPHQIAKPIIAQGQHASKTLFQLKPPSRETQLLEAQNHTDLTWLRKQKDR